MNKPVIENEILTHIPKFKTKQEWIEYYIKLFEARNGAMPDINEMRAIVELAEKSVDQEISKLYSESWLQKNFVIMLTVIIVGAAFLFIAIGGESAVANLNYVPDPMWDILTIVMGFWFGGSIGSNLIDRWKKT